jgi:hypothetical protein
MILVKRDVDRSSVSLPASLRLTPVQLKACQMASVWDAAGSLCTKVGITDRWTLLDGGLGTDKVR